MNQEELGGALRALRRERKLSLGDVSSATGISASFLSLVENGKSDITVGRLMRLAGFYDDRPAERTNSLPVDLGHRVGDIDDLVRRAREGSVDIVYITFPMRAEERIRAVLEKLADSAASVYIVPDFFVFELPHARWTNAGGLPAVSVFENPLYGVDGILKRTFDLVCGTVLLAAAAVPMFLIAVGIKLTSRGPVFFRQIRRGANGSTFRIYKFRTMVVEAEEKKAEVVHLNMHRNRDPRMTKIPDDPRVTTIGRLLRRFSIDELPQLINVVKGEMSLVGPRPLILEEDQYVQEWARKRLDIKPGITGLWQVLGRSDIPFDEMTKLDYVYVTNWSLREDIRLIFLTVPSLFRTRRAF